MPVKQRAPASGAWVYDSPGESLRSKPGDWSLHQRGEFRNTTNKLLRFAKKKGKKQKASRKVFTKKSTKNPKPL
jgi:hypothetical protein